MSNIIIDIFNETFINAIINTFNCIKMSRTLVDLYTDPKYGFSGINNLRRKAVELGIKNINSHDIKNTLSDQSTYTLHKPVRKKFRKEKVYVHHIDDQWQADLVEMIPISNHNEGYKYILTIIDVFSKYAWAVPLKSKTPSEVKESFLKIFRGGRKPKSIQTDDGMEFFGKPMRDYFKTENINHFSTKSELKASIVERFNRTIKEKMWRYFTFKKNYKWVTVLPDLIDNYNNSYHRSIQMKPVQVTKDNEKIVWHNLYGKVENKIKSHYVVDDVVRITKYKRKLFDKGYVPNWTEEKFIISKVKDTSPPTYIVSDQNGNDISGKFYENELQKISSSKQNITASKTYIVEKIIKERNLEGKKQFFVKWQGYPQSQNSWIAATDIV